TRWISSDLRMPSTIRPWLVKKRLTSSPRAAISPISSAVSFLFFSGMLLIEFFLLGCSLPQRNEVVVGAFGVLALLVDHHVELPLGPPEGTPLLGVIVSLILVMASLEDFLDLLEISTPAAFEFLALLRVESESHSLI